MIWHFEAVFDVSELQDLHTASIVDFRRLIKLYFDKAHLKINDKIPLRKQLFLKELDRVDPLAQVPLHHLILISAIDKYLVIVINQFETNLLCFVFEGGDGSVAVSCIILLCHLFTFGLNAINLCGLRTFLPLLVLPSF